MKIFRSLLPKAGLLILLLASFLKSSEIHNPNYLLIPKTEDAIINIANELYFKMGVHSYVFVTNSLEDLSTEEFFIKNSESFSKPFVYLLFSLKEKKIDIKSSKELESSLNKNSVYWDYMVPLLPNKANELTPPRISAVVLTGYNEIATNVSKGADIELESVMKNEYEFFELLLKIAVYIMIGSLFVFMAISYFKSKGR